MPGKKGFGDTRKKSSQSPAYKKQKYGTPKSPFTMKSPAKFWGGVMGTMGKRSRRGAMDDLNSAQGGLGALSKFIG